MEVRFSSRVPRNLRPNRIAEALRRWPPSHDLTASNPTACGIDYPEDLVDRLASPGSLVYRPDPRGLRSAREAVAADYRRHAVDLDPDRIVLTASTSEAYALLFKLLCEPGDAVLVPSPSYPLFDHLGALEAVATRAYHLDPDAHWAIDIGEIAAAGNAVRAIVAVHPNNPTGSFVAAADRAAIAALCRRRGCALIVDEVFLDYPLGNARASSFAAASETLTFSLGGLSKSIGLPQLKLAWIAVGGPADAAAAALERLEFIADTFLSVATPVQLALPALLREGATVRAQIAARCRINLAALHDAAVTCPAVTVLPPDGGWSAVLRFPAVLTEEELVLGLIEDDGVAVHPGFFFDFPREGYLVLSLLPHEDAFATGVRRVMRRISSLV